MDGIAEKKNYELRPCNNKINYYYDFMSHIIIIDSFLEIVDRQLFLFLPRETGW